MSGGAVTVEAAGDVAVVRIDRPPANALDIELLAEGAAVAGRLAAEKPGAVLLTGREGFFSAGVDLKLAPTLDRAAQSEMVDGINALFAAWYGLPRPVVCAVNGHAIAGGLILALCGDRRIAARAGRHGLTELRAGIPYPAVAMAVVRAELGPAAARRLVLDADLVDAERAAALGCYDEVTAPEDLLPRALEAAEALAALPRATYPGVKRQLRGAALAEIETVLRDGDPLSGGWLAGESADAAGALLRGRR